MYDRFEAQFMAGVSQTNQFREWKPIFTPVSELIKPISVTEEMKNLFGIEEKEVVPAGVIIAMTSRIPDESVRMMYMIHDHQVFGVTETHGIDWLICKTDFSFIPHFNQYILMFLTYLGYNVFNIEIK